MDYQVLIITNDNEILLTYQTKKEAKLAVNNVNESRKMLSEEITLLAIPLNFDAKAE